MHNKTNNSSNQPTEINALLFAPQYRPNMSSMIRSAEFYGLDKIYIYDNREVLKSFYSKFKINYCNNIKFFFDKSDIIIICYPNKKFLALNKHTLISIL